MSSQALTSTFPTSSVHSFELRPSQNSLCHLPQSLFDLVLCFLPLHDKLDQCSHLSKRAPAPTPAAFCYDELHIRCDELQSTPTSTTRFLHSPRHLSLLSQLSRLSCSFTQWLIVPTYDSDGAEMPFGVREVRLPAALVAFIARFSALSRLSIHCPPHNLRDTQQPPLPRLEAAETSLHSLAFESLSLNSSASWLLSTISPLSTLRNLSLAVTLHPDCLHLLLQQPLHILDLAGSRLSRDATPLLPATGSWVLASTCRVLRLPGTRFLVSDYYLDSIVERWPAEVAALGGHVHTLAIGHVMSETAVVAALAVPALNTLSVAVEGHKSAFDHFFVLATSLPLLNPPNIRLRLVGRQWRRIEMIQLCLDFLPRHPTHVRSLDVTVRRQHLGHTWLAHKLASAVSHCTRLQSLVLNDGGEWHDRSPAASAAWLTQPVTWAERVWLPQLRTLSLADVSEEDLCGLVTASPSLEYCAADVVTISLDLMSLLAASCPKLKSLHIRSAQQWPRTLEQDDEKQLEHRLGPELGSFRSLTSLTLTSSALIYWMDEKVSASANMATMSKPLFAGSPVQRLQVVNCFSDGSQLGLPLPVLLLLPQLEALLLRHGDGIIEPPPTAMWDDEPSLDQEEQPIAGFGHNSSLQPSRTTPTTSLSCSSERSDLHSGGARLTASPLHTLELTILAHTLPPTHLVALLSHTPHLTSITVTVRATTDSIALSVLHTFGLLRQYAPLIETVSFAFDVLLYSHPVLGVEAVRALTKEYPQPAHAGFGWLRRVRQVEVRDLVGEDQSPKPSSPLTLVSREAFEWLQNEWFGIAPLEDKTAVGVLLGAINQRELEHVQWHESGE